MAHRRNGHRSRRIPHLPISLSCAHQPLPTQTSSQTQSHLHSQSELSHCLPLKIFTLLFFFLDLVLFVVISALTVIRYWMFPELWRKMIAHPAQSLFIGAFPMGVATLINVAVATHHQWGFSNAWFVYVLWEFWWLDSFISALVASGMLYTMMTHQIHTIDQMAATWLLPFVTLIVASSTGGLLSSALLTSSPSSPSFALITTATSFAELAVGLTLALMIITTYLPRLILHGPSDVELILSAFIVLGPLGQGGFSLLVNGQDITQLFSGLLNNTSSISEQLPQTPLISLTPLTGQIIFAVCFCGAFLLWSMGLCWIVIAVFSIAHVVRREKGRGIPFSMAYWGLIFPNGVFGLLSVQLGRVTGSAFFRYFGAIWSVFVLIMWLWVFVKTAPGILDTSIFEAPYIVVSEKKAKHELGGTFCEASGMDSVEVRV